LRIVTNTAPAAHAKKAARSLAVVSKPNLCALPSSAEPEGECPHATLVCSIFLLLRQIRVGSGSSGSSSIVS
jgi:hypothetical protein